MTNPVQPLDPTGVPDLVTPRDSPSSPAGYAQVTPHGQGPAAYDIQAPQADLSGVFDAAGALTAGQENGIYPSGPRQAQTALLLQSPQGFALGGYDIDAGYPGSAPGEGGWPVNIEPGG